jgi:hypothetical protein
MTTITSETYKAAGRYRHAGQLDALQGNPAIYGCHYGMRSTRAAAILDYMLGYQDIQTVTEPPLPAIVADLVVMYDAGALDQIATAAKDHAALITRHVRTLDALREAGDAIDTLRQAGAYLTRLAALARQAQQTPRS